jgi:hypothetical protein
LLAHLPERRCAAASLEDMTRTTKAMLGAALILPWLVIWQGLDFTDQGYMLTIFRSFLHHPEAVAHTAHMWLTNAVGAAWDALFGRLGVVGQRGLFALCISCGMLVSFRTLRSVTGDPAAALGVLATSAFVANRRETWFSYNTLTALLACAIAAALFGGLARKRPRLLYLAGVLLGITPFARLPNVAQLALISAIAFVAVLERERTPQLARDLGRVVLGCAAGAASMLALIALFGHWPMYRDAVRGLFTPFVASSGHGSGSLIRRFISEHAVALPAGLAVLLSAGLFVQAAQRLPRLLGWSLYAALVAAGCFVLASGVERWRFCVVGALYFFLGAVAFGVSNRSVELRLACWLALVALVVTPLGSDTGLNAAHAGLWFALPTALATLYSAGRELASPADPRAVALAVACVLGGEALYHGLKYTYRDDSRLQLTASIDHPQLRAQFTSRARAGVVQEVLEALRSRIEPGDYLLAYEGTPLLQYLTSTYPYLGRPWIMVDDDPVEIAALLGAAPRTHACLPVAVRSRYSARERDWPSTHRPLEPKHAETRAVIAEFLARYHYKRTWRNRFFEILEPASRRPVRCAPRERPSSGPDTGSSSEGRHDHAKAE